MPQTDFSITYQGGEADENSIDMRLLALSLLGAERIVSDGLVILVNKRLPKRGERAPVILRAREPKAGSVEILGLLHAIFGALNLGLPLATQLAASFVEEWWKAVIARFSGKPDVAEAIIKGFVEMNKDHLVSRDASDTQRHEEMMALIDILRTGLLGQQRSAEQFVAPIGPSVETARVFPTEAKPVLIGVEEADAIRDGAKLVWGPLEQLTLRTDGFKFHTSGLSVENPERDGYLMARVRDPRFIDDPENPYTDAAQRRAEIVVLGRRGYKESTLAGIDIVDFIRDNPA